MPIKVALLLSRDGIAIYHNFDVPELTVTGSVMSSSDGEEIQQCDTGCLILFGSVLSLSLCFPQQRQDSIHAFFPSTVQQSCSS
mmetsp:Transcript_36743/g.41487  ORF Transcript_36743/g.41487 Transcript_36743/m.41487 type:complete len:84 (-) Transcript_36743:145-396(-)